MMGSRTLSSAISMKITQRLPPSCWEMAMAHSQEIANYSTGQSPVAMVTAEFTGDGHKDLATRNSQDNTVSVLLGNGNGTFKPAVSYPVAGGGISIASGDFNGDGKPDLAVENFSAGTVSVLLNLGNGTFAGHVDYPAGPDPTVVRCW